MATELKIHDAQTAILRELLFKTSAGFAEMQHQTKLSSDHFNFHINKLIELGLVGKIEKGRYVLSLKGKEYANKLDTDNNTIERQPKVAVLLLITRGSGANLEMLVQQRLKQPFYGFWGRPSGKIRWGETILECAARELKEETNLDAKFKFAGIEHKMDYSKGTGELLEDKIFHLIHCYDTKNELTEYFEGGRNMWIKPGEINKLDKYFEGLDADIHGILNGGYQLEEKRYHYREDEY